MSTQTAAHDVEIMTPPAVYLRFGGGRESGDSTAYTYRVAGTPGAVVLVTKSVGFAPLSEAQLGFAERVAATVVDRVTLMDGDRIVGYVVTDTGLGHRPVGDGWPTTDPHEAVRRCGWYLSPDGIVGTGGTYGPGEVSMWRPLADAPASWTFP